MNPCSMTIKGLDQAKEMIEKVRDRNLIQSRWNFQTYTPFSATISCANES